MTVTIGVKRQYEFTCTDSEGNPCIFQRDPSSNIFIDAFNYRTKLIDNSQPERYLAFPYVIKYGGSIVGIFSESDSHASGSRQWGIRSDDNGETWQKSIFFDGASFYTTLFEDLIPNGSSIVLKVFTITNNSGVFSVTTVPTVVELGVTYSLWSRPVPGGAGLYRTGYGANGSDVQTALFESSDNGITWSFVSLMFSGAGKLYSEADIINTSGSNWLSICREDSSSTSNHLYKSTSADGGATWTAPVLLNPSDINGRQPNLVSTTDGSIILSTSDRRSGVSGNSPDGNINYASFDTTGITVYRSTDSGSTWGFRTRIAPFYSSDGGQPYTVEISPNRVLTVYYRRSSVDTNPVISSSLYDISPL